MPARSARSTPPVPSRSAPTASTRNGAPACAEASIRAWRLLPEPETRTTSPSGSEAVGTGSVWHGAQGPVGQRRCSAAQPPGVTDARRPAPRCRARGAGRGTAGRSGRPRPRAGTARPSRRPRGRATARVRAVTVQADRATASLVRSRDSRATSARARRATKAPTATTTSTESAVNHGKSPGCGSAASTGTIGSSPPFEPDQLTEPPSTTRNPGPAMNDTAHSARFGSEATWARASTTPPRPPAATAVEIVVTWCPGHRDHRQDHGDTDPEQQPGADETGAHRTPHGVGQPGEPEPRPEHVGVVVGHRAQGEDERQQRHDHHGQHQRHRRDPERPGDGQADGTRDGDGVARPPRAQRRGERARQRAAPVLTVGGHVDHRLARPEPGHADEQGQPEQRHQRDGDLTDGQVRPGHQQPQRGTGAGGLPPVARSTAARPATRAPPVPPRRPARSAR